MYYVCLFKMVDLEAVKHDLSGLPPEMIPDLGTSVRKGVKLFVPIILLLVLMARRGHNADGCGHLVHRGQHRLQLSG